VIILLEYKKSYKMENCTALTAQGIRCTRDGHLGGLCGTHHRSLARYGPRGFGLKQLDIKYKELRRGIEMRRNIAVAAAYQILIARERNVQLRHIENETRREMRDLFLQRRDEEALLPAAAAGGAAGGAHNNNEVLDDDEDAVAHAVIMIQNQGVAGGAAGGAGGNQVFAGAIAAVQHAARELQRFTEDRQNVHTTTAVKQTEKIVNIILKVPVPEGYRWHPAECSKTPGEIIMECKLSQKAAWQMMSQYAQDTSIYEMGRGIYGKVLDSAWQFIKNHKEKESLVAILRIEMNDNVGMCDQGNLSRVCNILAGYMDGVGSQESLSERLGRLLPPLRKIENLDERRGRINEILKENAVPTGEWDAWIEAVME